MKKLCCQFTAIAAVLLSCLTWGLYAAETATVQADVFPMAEFTAPFRYQIITKGSDSSDKSWMLCYIKERYEQVGKICFGGKGQKEFGVRKELPPYQWSRITVCFDGTNAVMYLNGEKIGEMPRSAPENNSSNMVIGKYMWGTEMDFPGKIKNVIYEKRLIVPEKITPEGQKTVHLSFKNTDAEVPFTPVSGNWQKKPTGYREFSDNINVNALAVSKNIMPENFVFSADLITYDGIGIIGLEFCRQENGDGYRMELNNSSSLTFLSVFKIKNGKRSLLEEVNSMTVPLITSAKKQYPMKISVGRFNGMIHIQINDKEVLHGFDNEFKTGKVGLSLHERKGDFAGATVTEYPAYQVNTIAKPKAEHELTVASPVLRTVFYRDEKIHLQATFKNRTSEPFTTEKTVLDLFGKTYTVDPVEVPGMKTVEKEIVLDAADLRAGEYTLKSQAGKLKHEFKLTLVDRPNQDLYRFYNWGGWKIEDLNKYHFNGKMISFTPKDDFRKYREMLAKENDYAMKHNMKLGIHWHLQTAVPVGGQDMCILRKDGSRGPYLYPHNEKARKYLKNGITGMMELIQHYPAFNRFILDSEVESVQEMDYSEQSIQMAKDALGFEPPMSNSTQMEIDGFAGVRVSVPESVKQATPAVFPNDNKHYRFMHYFWEKGTGDNLLRVDAAEIIRKYRPDMLVYHEPYRDVPMASRMKGMDFGGTWYYCNPDGGESFMATESLLSLTRAMGKPEGFQIDPSLWLYRNELGPANTRHAGVHPANLYMTALQLAFAAKPSVIELYCLDYVMPETKLEHRQDIILQQLSDFAKNIVKPLWSSIQKLDREPRKSALLLSLGSQIFDREHWGGWGRQAQNAVLTTLWRANIPTAIVTEEIIKMGELDRYDQLFLHKTTRLPQETFDAIVNFAKRGGKVVVEPGSPWKELIPGAVEYAVNTDMIARSGYWPIVKKKGFTHDVVYNEQQRAAGEMKKLFRKQNLTFADSDSTELFVQTLGNKNCAYVFLQNDKRTFGDFLGKKYRAVYDQGLPLQATVKLQHKGAVYEFPAKKQLKLNNGSVTLDFNPVEQKILILYPSAVASLDLKAVPRFKTGKPAVFRITVNNDKGKLIPGVQPVRVVLTAPDGKKIEQYLSADNGLLEFRYTPGKNEPSGTWTLEAEELASGVKMSKKFNQ